jgi:3-isopropylmalate dehydrogenase
MIAAGNHPWPRKANPLAMLLSFAMMPRYSFDMEEDAAPAAGAAEAVPDSGLRTGDIMSKGRTLVSTEGMGEAVTAELDRRAA